MNTLIKPPCCNGGPESKEPVAVTQSPLWVVNNYHLIEQRASSWAEVSIVNTMDSDYEITYSDVCDAVREYNPDMGAVDIDEIAAEIVSHFVDNPTEHKSFREIVADYAAPSYAEYQTEDSCMNVVLRLFKEDMTLLRIKIEADVIRKKANEIVAEMMDMGVEDRPEYANDTTYEFVESYMNCTEPN